MLRLRGFVARFRRGFLSNVRFALDSIRSQKLRSTLTVLGIVVGVATVIAMVAIVSGFNNNIIGNLQAFGANRIEIQKYEDRFGPGGPSSDEERRRPNLTVADADALRQAIPEAAAVSTLCGYFDAEVHVKNGSLEANLPYVLGVDAWYLPATAYTLSHGRFFTDAELKHAAPVVIIGADVHDAIFPRQDPIDRTVTINAMPYRVTGVLERKGAQFGFSPDNKVILPHDTFLKQFGLRMLEDGVNINVVPRDHDQIDLVVEKTTAVLRERRRVPFHKPNNFVIVTPDQLISQFRAITGGVTGTMVFISLISLLIGGVGVMNIMLVSVTQRTREIGVRRAVGALKRDIVAQFLTEAATLSALGGAIGVALGVSAALLVKTFIPALPTSVPAWSLLLGLLVSVGVGVFFGAWPAIKAARLDPIESLRYE